MNLKSLFGILFFLFHTNLIFCQTTFQRGYAGITDIGYSVKQTSDGFIVTGYTTNFGNGGQDVYLFKTDSLGNLIWTKTFGGVGNDYANDIQITSNGDFIIAGATSFGAGGKDIYLIRTDANGALLWSRSFGRNGDDYATSIAETSDGGFIIGGNIPGTNGGGCLIKTNSLGDTLWTKIFNTTAINSIKQTFDGGYILTGGLTDIFLIKTDSLGNVMWNKNYGGAQQDDGNDVQQTQDGGYVVLGNTYSFGAGNNDMYLIKTDANGNLVWSKTYGEFMYNRGYSVEEITGVGYIMTGVTQLNSTGSQSHVGLIKTNLSGDTLWTNSFYDPSSFDYYSYCVQHTLDGGYIAVGRGGSSGIYLIKTDSNGNNNCNGHPPLLTVTAPLTQVTNSTLSVNSGGILTTPPTLVGSGGSSILVCSSLGADDPNVNHRSFIVYPNPVKDILEISLYNTVRGQITIFDITGQKVYSEEITDKEKIIDCKIARGIYLIQFAEGDEIHIQKIIKL